MLDQGKIQFKTAGLIDASMFCISPWIAEGLGNGELAVL